MGKTVQHVVTKGACGAIKANTENQGHISPRTRSWPELLYWRNYVALDYGRLARMWLEWTAAVMAPNIQLFWEPKDMYFRNDLLKCYTQAV